MRIRQASSKDFEKWFNLRKKLRPDVDAEGCREDLDEYLQNKQRLLILLAETPEGELTGLLEASLRRDYVEGCQTKPVGYIEGWFVEENYRRQNLGRKLVEQAEAWAKELGCQEMASDCKLENEISFLAHQKIGYEDVSRNIHFKKWL